MKLPYLNVNLLTKDETEVVKTWYERLKQNPIGNLIIENMEQDPHVHDDIRRKFFKNLIQRVKSGDSELEAVKNAISNDMLLMGPPIDKENLHDSLSKLMKVRTLFRYLNDNLTIFRDLETHGLIFEWIKNRTLTIEKNFKAVMLQEIQPICWSIFTHDVDNFKNIADIDELCDALEFLDFNEGDYIVELLYEKKNIENPRIPTFIEAGVDPTFYPAAEKGDLGATEAGIPEIVHAPIPFQAISSISCKCQKREEVPSFYEKMGDRIKKPKEIINLKKMGIALEEMDGQQIIKYIEERLRGKTVMPPISTRSAELPEYFLEKIYEGSQNDRFKSKFRNAIAQLLTKEQIKISNPDYLSRLLIFCERYIIQEAVIPVGGMVLSDTLIGKESIYGDLHLRALMALARMPQGLKMTELWVEAIEDERYTAAAFAALREHGLEKLTTYLSRFIRMHQKKPGSIDLDIALLTIYERFKAIGPEAEITKRIRQSLNDEPQGVKDYLENILKIIGKEMPPKVSSKEPPSVNLELEKLSEPCAKSIDHLIKQKRADPNRAFLICIDFAFFYVEAEEVEKAYYFLNRSLQFPIALEKAVEFVPATSKDVRLYPLKSLLCYKLLSPMTFESNQVNQDISAWRLIALLEEKSSRQTKWAELLGQIEQGKFIGAGF